MPKESDFKNLEALSKEVAALESQLEMKRKLYADEVARQHPGMGIQPQSKVVTAQQVADIQRSSIPAPERQLERPGVRFPSESPVTLPPLELTKPDVATLPPIELTAPRKPFVMNTTTVTPASVTTAPAQPSLGQPSDVGHVTTPEEQRYFDEMTRIQQAKVESERQRQNSGVTAPTGVILPAPINITDIIGPDFGKK